MDSLPSSAHESTPTRNGSDDGAGPFAGKTLVAGVAAAALAAVLLLAVFSSNGEDAPTEAEGLAALAFLTADGETSNLAAFEGEPLVVNFFASWCAPCRAELPDFEETHLANGDAVTFLGISHDLDEATWRTFVEETEVTYETVFQPNTEIWTELDAKGMPSTAFIAPDGEVLHVHTGVLNQALLQDLIDEHLRKA